MLIHDISSQDRFTDAWQNAMSWPKELSKGQRVVTALEHIRKINETISQDNKKKARQLYKEQFRDVNEAETKLQEDWSNLEAWDQLNATHAKLEQLRMNKLEKTKNEVAAKWMNVGDRCSCEFFKFHKDIRQRSCITELMDGVTLLTSQEDIADYVI